MTEHSSNLESVLDAFTPLSRPMVEATSALLHPNDARKHVAGGPLSIYGAVAAFQQRLEQDESVRIPFGVPVFDRATRGGPEPGELVLDLGRTGQGKTMVYANRVRMIARQRPQAAYLWATLEMPAPQLIRRLLRMESNRTDDRLDADIKSGAINLEQFCERFANLYFIDQGSISLTALARQAEDLAKQVSPLPIGALFIDHAGLIRGEKSANAYERASNTAIGLKQLARKLNCVVFTIVQANRAGKSDDGDPVALEAARDSGCYEENADFVITFGKLKHPPSGEPFVKLRLEKNRRGPSVPAVLGFDPITLRMTARDEAHGEQ